MFPPRCELCGRKAPHDAKRPFGGYELVQFADHNPQEEGGLSPGVSWFCPAHARAARTRTDLPSAEALAQLRSDYLAGRLPAEKRRWFSRRARG